MKIRIYIKIAKGNRGYKVEASVKANMKPIFRNNGYLKQEFLPTIFQAVNVTLPDDAFDISKRALELKISEVMPAVDIIVAEVNEEGK